MGASQEFEKLLGEVVKRHTSVEALSEIAQRHGMLDGLQGVSVSDLGQRIQERLDVVLLDDPYNSKHQVVRVGVQGIGFDGKATDKEKFFVNMLATTLAKDFMNSPLAGILPTDPLPTNDIELLQERYAAIESHANSLLAQMKSNLEDASEPFGERNGGQILAMSPSNDGQLQLTLNSLQKQRNRIASSSGDSMLELTAIDEQIGDLRDQVPLHSPTQQRSAFKMASHSIRRDVAPNTVDGLVDSLRGTIDDLANVAAEACNAAETASRTTPAFSVLGVQARPARPVGAIPTGRQMMLLLLASTVFAAIVSAAYRPFAQRGFESVEEVGKKLNLPVIATLGNGKRGSSNGSANQLGSSGSRTPVSNQIVSASKWILFCGLMLTIGFCLVNADIRSAFWVSPFHGLAQIVWTLQGN